MVGKVEREYQASSSIHLCIFIFILRFKIKDNNIMVMDYRRCNMSYWN